MFMKSHTVTITMQLLAHCLAVLQIFFPSIMHTLENIPHLVPTSLTLTVMGMSLDSLTVHTPPQPPVVHHMLLEFAAKEKLLQVCSVHNYRRTGFNCENLINVNCKFF